MKLVYFDNAATSYPKPQSVYNAVRRALEESVGNPGRSAHPAAMRSAETVFSAREAVADFFGTDPERVVFTLNATAALNMAIGGLPFREGRILISDVEHNAVLRTVDALCTRTGMTYTVCPTSNIDQEATLSEFRRRFTPDVRAVIMTAASNVDGRILPYSEIAAECSTRGVPFLLDASQLAGHRAIDMRHEKITVLCVPGHKGLLGPMGCGALLLGEGGERLLPTVFGGNGVDSAELVMGDYIPERYEPGTVAVPAIAGLHAGIRFLKQFGISEAERRENAVKKRAVEILSSFPEITVYDSEGGCAVLSFRHASLPPEKVAAHLARDGICSRAGLHCAPLSHRTLGTLSVGGTIRLSFGCFNHPYECDLLYRSLRSLN